MYSIDRWWVTWGADDRCQITRCLIYRCWCISDDYGIDRGYFRDDDHHHDDVPVRTIALQDTGQSDEYVIYKTGPLRCYQSECASNYTISNVNLIIHHNMKYMPTKLCFFIVFFILFTIIWVDCHFSSTNGGHKVIYQLFYIKLVRDIEEWFKSRYV